jgi:CO/xanthine dehydrogenase FAD-binding subunit
MSRNFDYHRASSTDDAVRLKASLGRDARFWAGGTDLMLWGRRKSSPITAAIDITALKDLAGVEVAGSRIRIGALASLTLIERSGDRHSNLRVLAETARLMCTPQTRTIASIGGNICNASPGADLIPPLVALGAMVRLRGADGARQLSLEQFITGVGQNDLAGDEMLTHIAIENKEERSACVYRRVARTAVDIALVSSAAYLGVDKTGKITTARISLGAVTPRPVRCLDAELLLVDSSLDALTERRIAGIAAVAGDYANPITDIRATKAYRTEMCAVLTRRCIEECVSELKQKAGS